MPNQHTGLPVAIANRENILNRIISGESVRAVAADLKITHAAISQQLAQDPEYQAARQTGTEAQLDRWQDEIQEAADALTVSRAREAFRMAAWRAEREFPNKWSAKTEMTLNGGPMVVNVIKFGSD